MLITVKKKLPVQNTGLELDHWSVIAIEHFPKEEQVRLQLVGYASKQARQDGLDPVQGAYHVLNIKNIPAVLDENDIEITPAKPYYDEYLDMELSASELASDPSTKQQRILQKAVRAYLDDDDIFSGAINDN